MPLSVLLVDDAAFLRSMLREILEASGRYRVVAEASDGVAALALHPELHPDLVISDLIMPGLDGIEMTRALVGCDPTARVVVAASADQEGAVLAALSAGARGFLLKPYSAALVLRLLEEPPVFAEPSDGTPCIFQVRIALESSPCLPAARARVLISRCGEVGEMLEVVQRGGSLPSDKPASEIVATLRSRHPAAALLDWMSRLPGVAGVTLEPADARTADETEIRLSRPVRSLSGTVRIRTALLDRLLDRLEESSADRDRLSQILTLPAPDSGASPHLERLGTNLNEMRAEVLAARLVPFDRIARRLERCVEEAGLALSRQAALVLSGGGSRVDLSTLDEISALLVRLLPRVLEAGVQRSDILRQLGRPERGEIRATVSRAGSALVITLAVRDSIGSPPPDLPGEEIRERVRALGGTLGVVQDGDAWRMELVVPAGLSVVRSYLCQAGGRLFAVPVGNIERAIDLDGSRIRIQAGRSFWEEKPGETIPLVRFERVPWVEADGASNDGFPALLYRVGPQRYALALDALLGEIDVVVRPLRGSAPGREAAATALLPDGEVAVVPDLPHLARVR